MNRLALFAFASLPLLAANAHAADAPLTRTDVETIVKEYIAGHPSEVYDALRKGEMKLQADEDAKHTENLTKRHDDLVNDPDSPVAGNPKGDVTLVEFFDYHCGYCKRMLPVVQELLKQDPNVRLVLKDLPILSPSSATAAKAALAVYHADKDKLFEFYGELLKSNQEYTDESLLEVAKKVGVKESAYKAELKKPDLDTILAKNKELAMSIGVQGTPAFVVDGQLVPGATDINVLKGLIAKARAAKDKK